MLVVAWDGHCTNHHLSSPFLLNAERLTAMSEALARTPGCEGTLWQVGLAWRLATTCGMKLTVI